MSQLASGVANHCVADRPQHCGIRCTCSRHPYTPTIRVVRASCVANIHTDFNNNCNPGDIRIILKQNPHHIRETYPAYLE